MALDIFLIPKILYLTRVWGGFFSRFDIRIPAMSIFFQKKIRKCLSFIKGWIFLLLPILLRVSGRNTYICRTWQKRGKISLREGLNFIEGAKIIARFARNFLWLFWKIRGPKNISSLIKILKPRLNYQYQFL